MKHLGWTMGTVMGMALLALVLSQGAVEGQEEKVAQYVGSETCAKVCHKTARQGEQLRIWQESRHAGAFETLGTDAAKAIGKKMGIDDPQKSDKCLKCHTTAHGVEEGFLRATYAHKEGVGCERCHGAGSLYQVRSVMMDRDKSIAAGLLLPDEKTCLQCHNEESPTYKPFDYKTFQAKIAHPKPE